MLDLPKVACSVEISQIPERQQIQDAVNELGKRIGPYPCSAFLAEILVQVCKANQITKGKFSGDGFSVVVAIKQGGAS